MLPVTEVDAPIFLSPPVYDKSLEKLVALGTLH